MLYGYDSFISDFKKLVDARDLSHAYLFFGEEGIGKFLHAIALANYIESGKFEEPDKDLSETLVVDFNKPSNLEQNKETVGIDSVREIEHFLYQTSFAGSYKVAILRDAEMLTDQAQNALLKILEEPPQNGVIIVIAKDLSVFLPTVASRFSKIYFPILSSDSILDFLSKYGKIGGLDKNKVCQESFGKIGRAVKLLSQDKDREKIKKILISLFDKKANLATADDAIEDVLKLIDKKLSNLNVFFEELEISLLIDSDKNSFKLLKTCQTLEDLATINVNKRLCLKNLFYNLVN